MDAHLMKHRLVDPLENRNQRRKQLEIRAGFGRTNSGVTFIREARPEQAATASGTEQKELLGKILSPICLFLDGNANYVAVLELPTGGLRRFLV
jgi:hypothetical protein